MKLTVNGKEIELQFTTKNYMELKKTLGADNLRRALLKAAHGSDYEVLAKGLKQFVGKDVFADVEAVYDAIDTAGDKQDLFFQFISELGENGFFTKATSEELKAESTQPDMDVQQIVDQIMPEMAKEMAKEAAKKGMTTGANTSKTSK